MPCLRPKSRGDAACQEYPSQRGGSQRRIRRNHGQKCQFNCNRASRRRRSLSDRIRAITTGASQGVAIPSISGCRTNIETGPIIRLSNRCFDDVRRGHISFLGMLRLIMSAIRFQSHRGRQNRARVFFYEIFMLENACQLARRKSALIYVNTVEQISPDSKIILLARSPAPNYWTFPIILK